MPTNSEIRDMLGLPRNTKTRQVLNHAIRRCAPGGRELLDLLERMDYLRIQFPGNPQYAAEVGKLRDQRDRLVDDIRGGLIPIPEERKA